MTQKRQRTVRLIADRSVEKAWAALVFLSGAKTKLAGLRAHDKCWVEVDEIGDFLRKRQKDAERVKYAPKDASTRYALRKNALSPRGWDDILIVKTLSTGVDQGFIEHLRYEGKNYFTYVPINEHDLWKLSSTRVPVDPSWSNNL